jgi:hypothetical protein
MLALRAASCEDQLRGHAGKKRRYWLVLKEIMRSTLRATILSAYVGMALVSSISARKKTRREVGGPAQRLQAQAAVQQSSRGALHFLNVPHIYKQQGEGGTLRTSHPRPTPSPDFFLAISAGECLVVSTVALCGAKLNSLTPLGSVVLPLLKITM